MPAVTRRRALGLGAGAVAASLAVPSYAQAAPKRRGPSPLRRAHAHNDYLHPRPLLDALDHHFGSVEADIWLVDGQLLVAHDEAQLDPQRTLQKLYLDPLAARVRRNGGRVYKGWPLTLQLLIDLKTPGDATYRALSEVLRQRRYRGLFSYAVGGVGGRVHRRAVTAVISGDRGARAPMEQEKVRYAFYDGRHEDLNTGVPASFIPLISGNWTSSFTWQGIGPMPEQELGWLNLIVRTAHAQDQTIRFWATPDLPGAARDAVWGQLVKSDVDFLNTDDLAGLEAFLRKQG
ncbi:phosphatidylinositol-specific phospholipase C/glycerophosphodiester phosphodiesterase family protein [Streptomyces boninensis]|uniref:phosphatidylinositol-specific phospholipase C/glycerophosphodiester phosphodiesterase family protein n=1 Tax=Streptomyces boninensis TaxID=2039455 RepID=UPI003B21E3B3